jgi:hypothetical protein
MIKVKTLIQKQYPPPVPPTEKKKYNFIKTPPGKSI